ncbi:MAG: uncharacterized protein KVP18_000897 [Porospora cf. gigantea A]|uniref:uncharacterized protein n=1 Tax=Porospora cf. gigantea A TaxID=2853593 RepID=UPI00355A30A1|nr:MAG: hypothetical protein KVP18_000897 [Porospora cf. gigantea A]
MRFFTVAVLYSAVHGQETDASASVGKQAGNDVQDALQSLLNADWIKEALPPFDADEGLKGLLESFLPSDVLRDLPDMEMLLNNSTVRGLLRSLGEGGSLEEMLSGVNLGPLQSLLEDPAAAAALIKSFGWRFKAFSLMQSVKSVLAPESSEGYLQQLVASVAAQPDVARMLADPRIAAAARFLGEQTNVILQTTASPTESDADGAEAADTCEKPMLKH